MASMPSCIGKSDDEIWRMFRDAHLSSANPEHELRRIHLKWIQIRNEVWPTSRRNNK